MATTLADLAVIDLLATADGFRIVGVVGPDGPDGHGTARVLRSADGLTWDSPPVELPGRPLDSGLLDGQPAFFTTEIDVTSNTSTISLVVEDGAGAFRRTTVFEGNGEAFAGPGAIGPLGAVLKVADDPDRNTGNPPHLLVSTDGVNVTQVDLPPELAQAGGIASVVVSADAITAMVYDGRNDGIDGTPVPTVAYVGTPRG